MHKSRLSLLIVCMGLAAPATAAITSINFSGTGEITYSNYDLVPPAGSPVRVSGFVNFGASPLPDNFTGTVSLNNLVTRSFGYTIAGAGIFGSSTPSFRPPFYGGRITLAGGRLTSVQLSVDNDGDLSDLYVASWRGVTGFYADDGIIREWGGTWTLDAVPETASWAMLISGFGLVGATLRRRRALQRPPLASLLSR